MGIRETLDLVYESLKIYKEFEDISKGQYLTLNDLQKKCQCVREDYKDPEDWLHAIVKWNIKMNKKEEKRKFHYIKDLADRFSVFNMLDMKEKHVTALENNGLIKSDKSKTPLRAVGGITNYIHEHGAEKFLHHQEV